MYAVLGPTGHMGSVVAETLLTQGQSVRVVVRAPEKGAAWKAKGAEVAMASYQDRAAMTKALAGPRVCTSWRPQTMRRTHGWRSNDGSSTRRRRP